MTIRPAAAADLPQMLALYAPYVRETTISFEYTAPTLQEFTERFQRITAHFPWLIAEENGEILGYAYADRLFSRAAYAWSAEPSIYVRQDCRHRGVGRALYGALEPLLADLGYVNLFVLVTAENENSLWFHERMGYQTAAALPHVGYKFGRWLDSVWMWKTIRDVEDPGSMPILALNA